MKSIRCWALVLVVFGAHAQAYAAVISPTDILANWTQPAEHPARFTVSGPWSENGGLLVAPDYGAIISDFVTSGQFHFSTKFNVADNDTHGIVWGYQDNDNHYRIAWGSDFGESGVGNPTGQGFGATCTPGDGGGSCIGFKVIKEVAGTSQILYSDGTNTFGSVDQSLSVDFDGSGFNVVATKGGMTVVDTYIADSMFATGKVGLHSFFHTPRINFTEVKFQVVPTPAAILFFAPAIAGLAFSRRKTH